MNHIIVKIKDVANRDLLKYYENGNKDLKHNESGPAVIMYYKNGNKQNETYYYQGQKHNELGPT